MDPRNVDPGREGPCELKTLMTCDPGNIWGFFHGHFWQHHFKLCHADLLFHSQSCSEMDLVKPGLQMGSGDH